MSVYRQLAILYLLDRVSRDQLEELMQSKKWLKAYWRWFLAAIDRKDYIAAFRLAEIIERIK